jgi:xanthine dehydrogenase iron-sulfur cluster and FAD-binding subunit A
MTAECTEASSLSILLQNITKLREGSPEKLGTDYGRMVSKPGQPFATLIVPLLEEMSKFITYQSKEQAQQDVRALLDFVDNFQPVIEK